MAVCKEGKVQFSRKFFCGKSLSTVLSEIVQSTIMHGVSPAASRARFLDKVEEEITRDHQYNELQSQLLKLCIKR
ncbi:hypothetical protein VP01_7712g1 [Puccinia sorghi]|uniref:Uncharacterized protein n=1 Tax=Puccinia sorghi TaxID=27349 RepID=A0A0L6UCD3_9BASI|nr:hypothetical protein VP01_7712g1 [Puccinia sorghi]